MSYFIEHLIELDPWAAAVIGVVLVSVGGVCGLVSDLRDDGWERIVAWIAVCAGTAISIGVLGAFKASVGQVLLILPIGSALVGSFLRTIIHAVFIGAALLRMSMEIVWLAALEEPRNSIIMALLIVVFAVAVVLLWNLPLWN